MIKELEKIKIGKLLIGKWLRMVAIFLVQSIFFLNAAVAAPIQKNYLQENDCLSPVVPPLSNSALNGVMYYGGLAQSI